MSFLPDKQPKSEHDKGRLFAKVYTAAKSLGVLDCPYYDELDIDRALQNNEMMREMVFLNQPLRADLLSENIFKFSNNL